MSRVNLPHIHGSQFERGSFAYADDTTVVTAGGLDMTDNKRELISPHGDKRLVRRDSKGRFTESDDLGKSLAQDVRKRAKTETRSGEGDRGDRPH
jgi:hypothetical protein